MSFFNSALGAMIGFSLGGPIGALIGGVIGSKFGSRSSNFRSRQSYTNNQKQQTAFFVALFACFAKLAKADGHVSKEEVKTIESYIKERFKFDQEQRLFAIKIFNQAKDDQTTYQDYAMQLASLLGPNKNALVMFYELLFELAMSDGVLDIKEEELLKNTTNIFGIDSNLFRDLKRKFSESGDDPYKVLGVEPSMPFDHIKKIYLKKRKEYHPDTLISKGLPDELIDRAREKFIEIQEAFKEIEKREK